MSNCGSGIQLLSQQVNGIYGYRRMTLTINRYRELANQPLINEKRIYRIMHTHDLQSVIRRKRKGYRKTKADHVAENILNREFKADKPNEKWCTDVTEFKYGVAKKAYLSAIIDLYDGSIVSYRFGHSNNNPLVFETIRPAIQALSDGARPLIHSDRGYQYTSKEFKRIIDKANMTHSMSRPGRCIDNAPIEGFWGSLKCEMYYLSKFHTYEELEKAIARVYLFLQHKSLPKTTKRLKPSRIQGSSRLIIFIISTVYLTGSSSHMHCFSFIRQFLRNARSWYRFHRVHAGKMPIFLHLFLLLLPDHQIPNAHV